MLSPRETIKFCYYQLFRDIVFYVKIQLTNYVKINKRQAGKDYTHWGILKLPPNHPKTQELIDKTNFASFL